MKRKGIIDPSDLLPHGGIGEWSRHVTRMSIFINYIHGFVAFIKKGVSYLKENIDILYFIFFKPRVNVLFVSGCPGGSRYYRCKNQSEMLFTHGITSKVYSQYSLNLLHLVDKFDVFIFQRVVYNQYIHRLVQLIKDRGKKIIYETDDLVFDPIYLPYMDYYCQMGKMERSWYENGIGREILENDYANHCVVATDFLAEAIKKKYPQKKVFVSYNRMGKEQIRLANKTLAKRNQIKVVDGKIRIGYFSGSKSHNKDLDSISDVLIKILKKHPNVIFMVVGHLDLNKNFSEVKNKIERISFVPVEKLPELILRADINIAPLEINNPFCQAKSALKFFESGVLGVPTIASATTDFTRCIRNGENGFIAENDIEWEDFLTQLIQSRDLREKIGNEAKTDSLEIHTAGKKYVDNKYISFVKELLQK